MLAPIPFLGAKEESQNVKIIQGANTASLDDRGPQCHPRLDTEEDGEGILGQEMLPDTPFLRSAVVDSGTNTQAIETDTCHGNDYFCAVTSAAGRSFGTDNSGSICSRVRPALPFGARLPEW